MAVPTWEPLDGPAGTLMIHLAGGTAGVGVPGAGMAGAGGGAPSAAAQAVPASTAVVVHDFPMEDGSAERTGGSLPALAERLAAESGWRVVAGCLRGVGGSVGDFSPCGWKADLRAIVDHAVGLAAGGGVWLVGFGVGGSISLCTAAGDLRVRGVACLGAPATLEDWARDPALMLEAARRVGVVHSPAFPSDLAAWAREFSELRPLEASASMSGKTVLVLHGADDDEVPVADGRRLSEAAGPRSELRILHGAGHRLRADPRAMALLAGWLERQGTW